MTVVHGPAVTMALTGDTYQLVQLAHAAAHEPMLLLSDLDNFFRPFATWTLVVDRLLWGGFDATGYRITSLLLHAVTAFLLGVAGRKLGLGWFAAAAVAVVWATSPFTDETVFIVAARHDLLLLAPWLLMVMLWPRSGEGWSRPRIVGVGLMLVLAAAAKETWVVSPGLVAALEYERTRSWRAAGIPTAVAGFAVAVYLVVYVALFAGSKDYMELGSHVFAKIPAQLAAFFYLEVPATQEIHLTWKGLLAVAVMAAILVSCLKWRVPGSLVAGCLFLLPTIPTLMVPYAPQRYLTIPYAGFLLLVAVWLSAVADRLPTWRWSIRTATVVVAILVATAGAVIVRADLEDYRTMAVAHAVLIEEAGRVAVLVVGSDPLLVVRDELTTPLLDIVRSPHGFPKLVFMRNYDPYGLIDAAALFEWVLAETRGRGSKTSRTGPMFVTGSPGGSWSTMMEDLPISERRRISGRRRSAGNPPVVDCRSSGGSPSIELIL